MAATASPHPVPSLRNMRDTYVNLLLSNGTQPADPPPPITPRAKWTPGQSLGAPPREHAVHWASPVTPVLTENEIRVAEVAANLVAAGDAEKRNKDAIRALADKLEQTERRNRELEATVRTEEKRKKEKRRVSYGEARRNIHFTPRTPRRSGALDNGSERRRSRKMERESFHEYPFHLELDSLRMEKAQWLQEREKFRSMMSDIKRNTTLLLDERQKLRRQCDASAEERNSHLQVIARLQSQLMEMKQREETYAVGSSGSNPLPNRDQRHHRRDADDLHVEEQSDRYRQSTPEYMSLRRSGESGEGHRDSNRGHHLAASSQTGRENSIADEMSGIQDEFGREEELQTELHLVNQENIRVSERNASLVEENLQLKEQMMLLEKEHADFREILKDRKQSSSPSDVMQVGVTKLGVIPSGITSAAQLKGLLDEVNLLESVSYAIHFETTPSEADRAQETLTDVGSFTSDQECSRNPTPKKRVRTTSATDQPEIAGKEGPLEMIKHVVHRLAGVRVDLCSKYGKWLEAVANDVSSTAIDTIQTTVGKERVTVFDISSECMNTEVINELVRS